MNSENKSLLVISVGPKTAPSRLPLQTLLADPSMEKNPASRPAASRRSACAASPVRTTRLFGATEIEGGFPHSEISGSKPVRGSPKLIAAYHVLHRLSAPRHPPDTLMALDCSHRQSAFSFHAPDRQIGGELTLARKDQFCFKRIRGSQRSSLDPRLVLEGPDSRANRRRALTSRPRTTCFAPSGPRPNALPLHDVRYRKARTPTGRKTFQSRSFEAKTPRRRRSRMPQRNEPISLQRKG